MAKSEIKPFYEKIRDNYRTYDDYMNRLSPDDKLYRMMLYGRMVYCVDYPLEEHRGVYNSKKRLKSIIHIINACVRYIFGSVGKDNSGKTVILGDRESDRSIAGHMGLPLMHIHLGWKVPSLVAISSFFTTLVTITRMYSMRKLHFPTLLSITPSLLIAEKIYREYSLEGIRLILTSNDVTPYNVAVLFRAKEEGIPSVRFEYASINSLIFNNVFADYYFYPATLHLKIRRACPMNKDLKYIEGGYVNVNSTKEDQNTPYVPQKLITYFTGHSDLYEFDDHYYIGQILEQKPEDHKLAIKVHPYDHVEDYNYLNGREDVTVYAFDGIRNGELINRSAFCISQDSSMSLEAKLTCTNSYFINYTWRTCCYAETFEYYNEYFETIDSSDFLHRVLHGEHIPVSIETFKQNDNMTYPHTFDRLRELVDSITKT